MTDLQASPPSKRAVRISVLALLAWIIVAVVAGFAVGWLAGSYTACASDGCKARVDSIGAIGTWVGGLGTVAAVLAAVAAFRSEEAARDRTEHQRRMTDLDQARLAGDEASQVRVTCDIESSTADKVRGLSVSVTNGATATPLYKLRGTLEGYGQLKEEHTLKAGVTSTSRFAMGYRGTRAADVVPKADRELYIADRLADVTVRFEMNGRRWTKKGDGTPIPE